MLMHVILSLRAVVLFFRGGKGQFSEALSHQLEHMSVDLKKSQQQVVSLTQQLADAQRSHRARYDKMVGEFTRSMQTRDDMSARARQSEIEMTRLSDANTKTIQVRRSAQIYDLFSPDRPCVFPFTESQ